MRCCRHPNEPAAAGPVVDDNGRAELGAEMVGQQTREILYAFVEFEINRPVQVIGGQL